MICTKKLRFSNHQGQKLGTRGHWAVLEHSLVKDSKSKHESQKCFVSGQRNYLNIIVIFTSMRKLSEREADLIVISLMYY